MAYFTRRPGYVYTVAQQWRKGNALLHFRGKIENFYTGDSYTHINNNTKWTFRPVSMSTVVTRTRHIVTSHLRCLSRGL
jgi:hypothetical protein